MSLLGGNWEWLLMSILLVTDILSELFGVHWGRARYVKDLTSRLS